MKIITHTCENCGTIVAANELEERRVMKCPGLSCENVLKFEQLLDEDRIYLLENREKYRT